MTSEPTIPARTARQEQHGSCRWPEATNPGNLLILTPALRQEIKMHPVLPRLTFTDLDKHQMHTVIRRHQPG
jgi:hypothetical protein